MKNITHHDSDNMNKFVWNFLSTVTWNRTQYICDAIYVMENWANAGGSIMISLMHGDWSFDSIFQL